MIRDGEIRIDRSYHDERVRVNQIGENEYSVITVSWNRCDENFVIYSTQTEESVLETWPEIDETSEVIRILESYE
jgi:hypothetical protein